MEAFLGDKFSNSDIVGGLEYAEKPSECYFKNYNEALEMLHKHIKGTKTIAIHTDVDVDGIGSAYILDRFIQGMGQLYRAGYMINSAKTHGITEKHVEYINKNSDSIGILIILDSSTNELDLIKRLKCDVLVIDHHEILHNSLSGKTETGEYVIINNMANNLEDGYTTNKDMSCGLVLYELLRLYENKYNTSLIEDSKLYQWACITLYTDAIHLATNRNQYYIDKTINTFDIEPTLKILLENLSKFDNRLNKTFINFTLAPRINKAIRAGASKDALNIVLRQPHEIDSLSKYVEKQNAILSYILDSLENNSLNIVQTDTYNIVDITETGISKNYCGVIASKLLDKTHRDTAVCINTGFGLLEGSFRGIYSEIDYRAEFEINERIYAQGHALAFGFKATKDELIEIMNNISLKIPKERKRWYLTAGDIPDSLKGIHHIDSMTEFKKKGNLLKLAVANSKLSTDESIEIHILNSPTLEVNWKEKYGTCNILGLECKIFEKPITEWLSIYVEYRDTIEIYLRNVSNNNIIK